MPIYCWIALTFGNVYSFSAPLSINSFVTVKAEPGYRYQFTKWVEPRKYRINVDFIRIFGNVTIHYALALTYVSKNIEGRMAIYPELLRKKWAPVEDEHTAIHRLQVMLTDAAVDEWDVKRVSLNTGLTQTA